MLFSESFTYFKDQNLKFEDIVQRQSMTVIDQKRWKGEKLFDQRFSIWIMSRSWHHSRVTNLKF